VVYDDWFTTVSSDGSLDNIENPEQWINFERESFDHDEPMVLPVAEDLIIGTEMVGKPAQATQEQGSGWTLECFANSSCP
jgi:hypothetical protein